MRLNPVTITISDHHLVEAINALQRVLAKLTEGSATHRRFEDALAALIDERTVGLRQGRETREKETT